MLSSQTIFVADWFGARARSCSALAMMHSTTVRRSCQPMPGPTGAPVARSHTIVEARWVGDADGRRRHRRLAERRRGDVAARQQAICGRVELHQTRRWRRRREAAVVDVVDGSIGRHRCRPETARTDVDDEDAHRFGTIPRFCRLMPSRPPISPANIVTVSVKTMLNQLDLGAANQVDDDEHALHDDERSCRR